MVLTEREATLRVVVFRDLKDNKALLGRSASLAKRLMISLDECWKQVYFWLGQSRTNWSHWCRWTSRRERYACEFWFSFSFSISRNLCSLGDKGIVGPKGVQGEIGPQVRTPRRIDSWWGLFRHSGFERQYWRKRRLRTHRSERGCVRWVNRFSMLIFSMIDKGIIGVTGLQGSKGDIVSLQNRIPTGWSMSSLSSLLWLGPDWCSRTDWTNWRNWTEGQRRCQRRKGSWWNQRWQGESNQPLTNLRCLELGLSSRATKASKASKVHKEKQETKETLGRYVNRSIKWQIQIYCIHWGRCNWSGRWERFVHSTPSQAV